MTKRLRVDVNFTEDERKIIYNHFIYTKSLRRTVELANSIMHSKGKGELTRNSVRNWFKKYYPEVYKRMQEERKINRIQKRLEKSQKEEYDLRDLVYVGRR